MRETAATLRGAIAARDVAAVVALVSEDGIPCGDGFIDPDYVREQIRDPGAAFHQFLFDAKGWAGRKHHDSPVSLAEAVAGGPWTEVRIEHGAVGIVEFGAQPRAGVAFEWSRGRWTFSGWPYCDL